MRIAKPGYFRAKAYLVDAQGRQTWPDGPDVVPEGLPIPLPSLPTLSYAPDPATAPPDVPVPLGSVGDVDQEPLLRVCEATAAACPSADRLRPLEGRPRAAHL